jgi:hypothetical protein
MISGKIKKHKSILRAPKDLDQSETPLIKEEVTRKTSQK